MKLENEIYALASQYVPAGTEELTLRMLCRAAERELRGRLRPGLKEAEYQDALICAAAWIAAGSLPAAASGTGVQSFQVGEVSIHTDAKGSASEQLRELAEQVMLPYITGGFAFMEV